MRVCVLKKIKNIYQTFVLSLWTRQTTVSVLREYSLTWHFKIQRDGLWVREMWVWLEYYSDTHPRLGGGWLKTVPGESNI